MPRGAEGGPHSACGIVVPMSDWLSFWNAERRRLARLEEPFKYIYIEYGEGKGIGPGDVIYCVGIEKGDLHLFTRVEAGKVEPDPDPSYTKSVRVTPKVEGEFRADYLFKVKQLERDAVEYECANGVVQGIALTPAGGVVPQAFQGRASIRRIVAGAQGLADRWAEKMDSPYVAVGHVTRLGSGEQSSESLSLARAMSASGV